MFCFCEGFKESPFKVMYGGPMMGIALPSLDLPITKRTNAILALNEKKQDYQKHQIVFVVVDVSIIAHYI